MRIRSALSNHPLAAAIAAIAGVGVIVFVLVFFEPQALFIDDEVSEAVPSVAAGTGGAAGEGGQGSGSSGKRAPDVSARGSFIGVEGHSGSGTAQVLELEDDSRFLRFEDDFEVSNGPDLKVYLSAAPQDGPGDAFDDDFVELGDLKGNIGSQNYELPASVDVDRYRTAVAWCERFSVGFAAAELR